jgi:hypothetical protein
VAWRVIYRRLLIELNNTCKESGPGQDFEYQMLVGKTSTPADLLALALCGGTCATLYGTLRVAGFDLDGTPITGI